MAFWIWMMMLNQKSPAIPPITGNMWTANTNWNRSVSKITPAWVITTYTWTWNNPFWIAFDWALLKDFSPTL